MLGQARFQASLEVSLSQELLTQSRSPSKKEEAVTLIVNLTKKWKNGGEMQKS
jgi:hypothetical protein